MNKRGVTSKVFVYLSIMMVIGTLLLIGSRAIMTVTDTGCEALASSFERDLFSLFTSNRNPGSLQRSELSAPCDASAICIGKDTASSISSVEAASSVAYSPTNIFLIRDGDVIDTYAYEDLGSAHTPTCIPATGNTFRMIVEGHDGAQISVQQQ